MADSDNPVTGPEDFSTDAGELQVGYKFLKSVGDETLPMEASEIVEFVNENSENLFGEAVHVFTKTMVLVTLDSKTKTTDWTAWKMQMNLMK